jgi:hypothetical protein
MRVYKIAEVSDLPVAAPSKEAACAALGMTVEEFDAFQLAKAAKAMESKPQGK